MKAAAFAVAALGFAVAGAAAAQDQVSDQAFLQASRCKGLAMGLGEDAKPLKAFVNSQSRSRADVIIYRGQAAAGTAQREAQDPAKKDKAAAEFASACGAYGGSAKVAGGGGGGPASTVR